MVAKRIIPCLDVKDGRTVKGINFEGLRDVGDAVALGSKYAREGADELVYLDISATQEGRHTFTQLVSRIAAEIDIPFTVGGGISTLDDLKGGVIATHSINQNSHFLSQKREKRSSIISSDLWAYASFLARFPPFIFFSKGAIIPKLAFIG